LFHRLIWNIAPFDTLRTQDAVFQIRRMVVTATADYFS
jgi:hypothetical protein